MAKTSKVLIGAAVGVPVILGLFVGGLYLGGLVFAALQKIPSDTVTIMTLHDSGWPTLRSGWLSSR
jgi:hypothetical protein